MIFFGSFPSNQYITKSWDVAFNVATLTLSHVSSHVILILFSKFLIQFENIFCQILIQFPALSLL